MRVKLSKGAIGYLMIPLIVIMDIILFYYDNVVDHGQTLLYLNTYGQGFLTWWWNFEWFWGFVELGTIKACLIAAWLIYYSPPGAQIRNSPKKSPWILGLIILIAVALIFCTSSPNSPTPYNAGVILISGWDPAFGSRHLLEILLFATGFWTIPILFFLRRRKTPIRRWNRATGILLCLGTALTTHLIFVGTWQVEDVFNLESIVLGAGSFLFVTFPVVLANLASFMQSPGQIPTTTLVGRNLRVNWQDFLVWILILLGFLGLIFGIVWNLMNTSIDFGAQWIPYNFWSLIYVVLLSTALVQIAWWHTTRSHTALKSATTGGVLA